MSVKSTPQQKQYWRDVEALAGYEPRKQALRWLFEGNPESYIQWARTDGYWAAHGKAAPQEWLSDRCTPLFRETPLDEVLCNRHHGAFHAETDKRGAYSEREQRDAFQAHKATRSKVEHYFSTPIQLLVMSGSVEALEAALAFWASPAQRFARGFSGGGEGWNIYTKTERLSESNYAMRRMSHWPLAFALLLGRFEHAAAMARRGYCPDDEWGWEEFRSGIRNMKDGQGALRKIRDALREMLGVEPLVDEASDWVGNREQAFQGLNEAMRAKAWTPEARAKAVEMLENGVSPGCYALARATEFGDKELLLRMFARGADPNCRYESSVPMLARLDSQKLTPELLQIWLDAGANPTMRPADDSPFGDGMCPSALYEWVFEGATELVVQACSKAAGPVELRLKTKNGKPWSPLLALALSRGHRDLVRWMVEEKGCSLEDLADDEESTCAEFGAAAIREFALAYQERRELMIDPGRSTAPPLGYGGNRL